MRSSLAIPVTETSQIGEARRAAVALADATGLDEEERGRIALVVTEAATNLVRHGGGGAGSGQIVLRQLGAEDGGTRGIEVLALDYGRGISDVAAAFRDGYSTAGTAGEGLGAIRRQSSRFDLYSQPGGGTALLAQIRAPASSRPERTEETSPPLELGVVSVPKPGEEVCGDAWGVAVGAGSDAPWRFVVADGLGHGPLAAQASQEQVRIFEEMGGGPDISPARVLRTAHAALRSTRGAAAAVAFVDASRDDGSSVSGSSDPRAALMVRFSGVGNIAASLITSPTQSQGLASHNGTVGHQVSRFPEQVYPLVPPALLLMASDGLLTQWRFDRYPGLLNRHASLIAGVLYRDLNRGRDDVTVLVARLTSRAPQEEEAPA